MIRIGGTWGHRLWEGWRVKRIKPKQPQEIILAGYSLIHCKYVNWTICHSCKLVPLSVFECWLVMNVNIAFILVRAGLMSDCVETAVVNPQSRSVSGPGSCCLRKTKEPVRRQSIHPTMNNFQCKLLYRKMSLGKSNLSKWEALQLIWAKPWISQDEPA